MPTYIQVITTVAEKEQAEAIARHLLAQRLAACIQIEACDSMYHWQGAVEQDREYRCTVKTRQDLYPKVEQALAAVHPYEVPEILAIPILCGAAPYLAWLDQEIGQE